MLAGREREGLPKLLAEVDVDLGVLNSQGLITARLRRPGDELNDHLPAPGIARWPRHVRR